MKTDEIQEEIERTRGEMSSTLDAIERKLSPRQLMDQAVDTMREIASDQSAVGHVVRENPIPLALIGLGVGWLALSGIVGRNRAESGYEGYEGAGMEGSAWAGGEIETARSSEYGFGYAAGGTSGYGAEAGYVSQPGGNGQGLRERAGQMAGQARETLSRAGEQTRRRVTHWSRSARYRAGAAADRTWDAYQEHPITMGVMALMVGAVLGAIVPRSRTEAEIMGGRARGALRQAGAAAGELADRVSHVAETAIDKTKEELREGFQDVKEVTREEAQRQGLAGSSGPGSSMTH